MLNPLVYSFFLLTLIVKLASTAELKIDPQSSKESLIVNFCLRDDFNPEVVLPKPSKNFDTVFKYLRQGVSVPSVPSNNVDPKIKNPLTSFTSSNVSSPSNNSNISASVLDASTSTAQPSKFSISNSSCFKRTRLSSSNSISNTSPTPKPNSTTATTFTNTTTARSFSSVIRIPTVPFVSNTMTNSPPYVTIAPVHIPLQPQYTFSEDVFTLHRGCPLAIGPIISHGKSLTQFARVFSQSQYADSQKNFVIIYSGAATPRLVERTVLKCRALKHAFSDRVFHEKLIILESFFQKYPALVELILAIHIQSQMSNITSITIIIKEEYKYNVQYQDLFKHWDPINTRAVFQDWRSYL